MGLRIEWFGGFRETPVGEEGWALLGELPEARLVARSRTSRTDAGLLVLPSGPVHVHRKIYAYRGAGEILRGVFRTTFAAPSRARREVLALGILAPFGFAPDPVGIAERRAAGFLREARVAVRTVAGAVPLDDAPPFADLARALGRTVAGVHRAGLGDLSLSPRNILASRGPGGALALAKVDSGRLRKVPPGGPVQADDVADLLAGLEGRWGGDLLDALRESYAAEAGGLPVGTDAALPGARSRLRRRDPR